MPEDGTQLEVFPTCLQLKRVDTARNMRRFYRMIIQRDLFGGASLVQVWGRIGTQGRQLINNHADEGQSDHRSSGACPRKAQAWVRVVKGWRKTADLKRLDEALIALAALMRPRHGDMRVETTSVG